MRTHFVVSLALALAAPSVAACMGSPPAPQQPAAQLPDQGKLPEPYEGPLTGAERVAWVQAVGAGTRIGEFRFFIYVDGRKQPLPHAECRLMQGSRHHVCEAPLPEMSPGKHTLQFAAVRIVDGKEKASSLSEPLTVTRSLQRGS